MNLFRTVHYIYNGLIILLLKVFVLQQHAHENTEGVNRKASYIPITAADPLHKCTRFAVLNAVPAIILVHIYL